MLIDRSAAAAAAALDVESAAQGVDSPSAQLLPRTSSGTQLLSWPSPPAWLPTGLCSRCCAVSSELLRRIKLEVVVELPMLRQRWLIILFGVIMQYVHGIFTQLAHRMHRPQEEPLHDVGFDLTPELGPEHFWVSEAIFGTLFASFAVWTFTPFVLQRKRFYTVVMWSRLLMVLVVCQALRIVTFSVTQLPGPSYHCRAGEATAVRPWPEHWTGHVVVDVGRQMSKSCGDLIFSSHTTFMLTGILAYTEYGQWPAMKAVAWLAGAVVSTLIVASRKHYTVDVVIAWYTVPLVFYTLHRRWTTRRPMSDLLGVLGENDEPDPATPDGAGDGVGGGGALEWGGVGAGAGKGGAAAGAAALGGGHAADQVAVDIKGLGDQQQQSHLHGTFKAPTLSQPKGRSFSTLKLAGLASGGVVDASGAVTMEEHVALLNGNGGAQHHHNPLLAGGSAMGAPAHPYHRSSQSGGAGNGGGNGGGGGGAFALLVQHLQQLAPGGGLGGYGR